MVGDISDVPGDAKPVMKARYRALSESDIASIQRKYGGDHLVSDADYAYPVLFDSGTYKVFALSPHKREE